MERTQFHALDGDTHIINSSEHDHLCIDIVLFDEVENFYAINVRHFYIEQDQIKKGILNGIYRFNTVDRRNR